MRGEAQHELELDGVRVLALVEEVVRPLKGRRHALLRVSLYIFRPKI